MTMQGGAIFYTPDITSNEPVWKEVFDNTAAMKLIDPAVTNGGPSDNGGWLQTSPDDTKLYHAVIGRKPGALGKDDPGTAGGVFTLDISQLVDAGDDFDCSIETKDEIENGGAGADCPSCWGTSRSTGAKASGPHWGALDNLEIGEDGFYHETDQRPGSQPRTTSWPAPVSTVTTASASWTRPRTAR